MSKRYSGSLELSIRYVDRDDSYTVHISEINDDARFPSLQQLRLSPWDQARLARDSAKAYDRVAESALSFASYADEMIGAYAESDPETGEFRVRRKLWEHFRR